jgi:hypothetical protein
MSAPGPTVEFEVGVAIAAADDGATEPGSRDDQRGTPIPGYDEAWGAKPGRNAEGRRPALVLKGAEAVRAATDAIAGQIGITAQRIAAAVEAQSIAAPEPGQLGLESVEVTFGITLSAGVQAMFTAQAESSAQVCITLARRPAST